MARLDEFKISTSTVVRTDQAFHLSTGPILSCLATHRPPLSTLSLVNIVLPTPDLQELLSLCPTLTTLQLYEPDAQRLQVPATELPLVTDTLLQSLTLKADHNEHPHLPKLERLDLASNSFHARAITELVSSRWTTDRSNPRASRLTSVSFKLLGEKHLDLSELQALGEMKRGRLWIALEDQAGCAITRMFPPMTGYQ